MSSALPSLTIHPLLLLRLLLFQSQTTATPQWSYVTLFDGNVETADFDGNINRIGLLAGDVSVSSTMSVNLTQETGVAKLRETANLATAGRTFVERSWMSTWIRIVVVYAVENADLTITQHGSGAQLASQSLTAGTVTTINYGSGFWGSDIVSTGDIVAMLFYGSSMVYSVMLLPPANVIFGLRASGGVLVNPGGTAMQAHTVCSNGAVADVDSNRKWDSTIGWAAPVCRYEAPAGQTLAGMQIRDGVEFEAAAWLSTDQFQVRIILPVFARRLVLISELAGQCTIVDPNGVIVVDNLAGFSETAGAPGVYQLRLDGQGAGTKICCTEPFGVVADLHCGAGSSPSCESKESNIFAMARPPETPLIENCLPNTTTTSTTTFTTTTTSTTTSSTSSSSSITSSTTSTTTTFTSTTNSSTTTTSSITTTSSSSSSSTSLTTTSTTTTTPEVPISPSGALLEIARKWEDRELGNLQQMGSNFSNITFSRWGITTTAARGTPDWLSPLYVGDTGTSVRFPASMFAQLGLDTASVTATRFDERYHDRLSWPSDTWEGEGGVPIGQWGAGPNLVSVNVSFVMHLELTGYDVSGLTDPIEIHTGINWTEGIECVYWDEAAGYWSNDGVTTVETDEGELVCLSTHFTLFGAIIRGFLEALLCSQVTLLRAEAIKELGKGDWYRSTGSRVLWLLLGSFLLLSIIAAAVDCRNSRHTFWNDEHFLVIAEELNEVNGEEQQEEEKPAGRCAGLCTWCKESNALKNVLDEIASNYWKHFAEVRDVLLAVVEGAQCSSGNSWSTRSILHSVLTSVMASSAQRQAAAAEGISADFAAFAMEDDELHNMLVTHQTLRPSASKAADVELAPDNTDKSERPEEMETKLPGNQSASSTALPSGGTSSTRAPREEAWTVVLDGLRAQTQHYSIMAGRYRSLPGAICRLLFWQHPIGVCLLHCVFLTSKIRVLLFLVDTMGSVMLGTVFFTTTGTVPSKRTRSEDCKTQSLGEAIGRLILIAFMSVLLSSIPTIFLGSLCTRSIKRLSGEGPKELQRQLWVWKVQDAIIYAFGTLYLLFCFFFICLFLANTAPEDQEGWLTSILMSLLLDNVIIPLSIAVTIPLLAAIFLSLLSCIKRSSRKQILEDTAAEIAAKQNMTLEVVRI